MMHPVAAVRIGHMERAGHRDAYADAIEPLLARNPGGKRPRLSAGPQEREWCDGRLGAVQRVVV
jgi:hypothetical protein